MSASGIRAVTFDVGGTLIEPWPSVGHVYARVAARHGFGQISPRLLSRRFVVAWNKFGDFRHTRRQWAELVEATFARVIGPSASRSFFPELFHCFTEPRAWRIYDDVVPTLHGLRGRGLKLGVISNWDERLKPLLGRLGLGRCFDVVVVSCDVGVTKPSPRVFQASAEQLGLEAGTILHIGDDPVNDFHGARPAGFQAVLLNRDTRTAVPSRIRSLRELEF